MNLKEQINPLALLKFEELLYRINHMIKESKEDMLDNLNSEIQPIQRLETLSLQRVYCDHIRYMIHYYEDLNYQSNRWDHLWNDIAPNVILNTGELNQRNINTCIRIRALLNLKSDSSQLEVLVAEYDIMEAYFNNNMINIANENLDILLKKLQQKFSDQSNISLDSPVNTSNGYEYDSILLNSIKNCYNRIQLVFKIIRENIKANGGYIVITSLIDDLQMNLYNSGLLLSRHDINLCLSRMRDYFEGNGVDVTSWDHVIQYLRKSSTIMKQWQHELESYISLQDKTILTFLFQETCRKHPIRVNGVVIENQVYPSDLMKEMLEDYSIIGMRLLHDHFQSFIQLLSRDITTINIQVMFEDSNGNICNQDIKPELPILWEEFLLLYIQSITMHPKVLYPIKTSVRLDKSYVLLYAKTLCLQGKLVFATKNILKAEMLYLQSIEVYKDLHIDYCIELAEVFECLSTLMIAKYHKSINELRESCDMLAKESYDRLLPHHKQKIMKTTSIQEWLQNIKNDLFREKMQVNNYFESILLSSCHYLERAYELYQVLVSRPSICQVSLCLAISSIMNLMKNFKVSLEWIMKALNITENLIGNENLLHIIKLHQISYHDIVNVFLYQEYYPDAIVHLEPITSYYFNKCNQYLLVSSSSNTLSSLTHSNQVRYSYEIVFNTKSQNYEEIQLAIQLLSKLMDLNDFCFHRSQSLDINRQLIVLLELTYGWDSIEVYECHKLIALRYAILGDWNHAIASIQICIHIIEVTIGIESKQYNRIQKILQSCFEKRLDYIESLYENCIIEFRKTISRPIASLKDCIGLKLLDINNMKNTLKNSRPQSPNKESLIAARK